MAVFGWMILVLCLSAISMLWVALGFQYMGTFNIGGAVNPWQAKVGYLLAWVFFGFLWVVLIQAAPFTIAMK